MRIIVIQRGEYTIERLHVGLLIELKISIIGSVLEDVFGESEVARLTR